MKVGSIDGGFCLGVGNDSKVVVMHFGVILALMTVGMQLEVGAGIGGVGAGVGGVMMKLMLMVAAMQCWRQPGERKQL